MTKSPRQQNLSEHKKALQCRSQRIQQRERIINQKRRSYSTNLKPTRPSSFCHHSSRSEFKFGHQLKSMIRKDAPFSNQLEDIPKFVNDLNLEWNSFHTVLNTTSRFRKLLSHDPQHPPATQVIDSGAVQYFVQLLNPTHIERYCQIKKTSNEPIDPSKTHVTSLHQLHALQFEVTSCIRILVGGTSDHVKYIVETGCVPLLINLIESKEKYTRGQSVWAIGNIAGDSETMRDYVIGLGAMKHLINLVKTDPVIANKRYAVWSISNLLKGKKTPEHYGLITDTFPLLCQLILNHEMDEELLLNACWALFHATNGPLHTFQYITIQKDVIMVLVELLNSSNLKILTSVISTLGTFLSGYELTRMIISCGVLPGLTKLFEHPNRAIRKLVIWSLSNITAGDRMEIQEVINAEIFPKLINMLSPAHNEAVIAKQQIYYVITNALSRVNSDDQIHYLIDQGVIQVLCGGLDMKSKILQVLLDGLVYLLKYGDREKVMKIIQDCGGVERIKALQQHRNEEVQHQAHSILETYWK